MKYLHLIWAALFRSKTRTSLTLLSVIAAFLLFGMLDSVRVAFNSGGQVAGANRMVTMSRLSITQMLPYSLTEQVLATPGVKDAAFAAWFGGIYQDPKNFFANFSVSPNYLDLYPEFKMPAAQKKAWQDDRTGAIVGESLAKLHGWKIGDTIPLQATIFPTKGSNDWQFTLRGIYTVEDPKQKGQERVLFFHWKYFDEANDYVKGRIGWFIV
ncbi:MAG: ABC transporter permease, partial [Thermomonas sp.]